MAKEGRHVLIVEDDENFAALMERILGRAGYQVSLAVSVEAALFAHDPKVFDIVILDVFMSGIGGVDGISEFATFGWNVPIISTSAGYGDMEPDTALRAATKAGAAAILPKPFKKDELLDLVAGCLDGSD